MEELTEQVKELSEFAKSHPPAAFAAFTHGISSKWNNLLRFIVWEAIEGAELLQPIEATIRSQFMPALTGQPPPGDLVHKLLPLLVQLGELGLTIPLTNSLEQHATSKLISDPLVQLVIQQDHQLKGNQIIQQQIMDITHNCKQNNRKEDANHLEPPLSGHLQRCMELVRRKVLQLGSQRFQLKDIRPP